MSPGVPSLRENPDRGGRTEDSFLIVEGGKVDCLQSILAQHIWCRCGGSGVKS